MISCTAAATGTAVPVGYKRWSNCPTVVPRTRGSAPPETVRVRLVWSEAPTRVTTSAWLP